jgi:hypothetical protein
MPISNSAPAVSPQIEFRRICLLLNENLPINALLFHAASNPKSSGGNLTYLASCLCRWAIAARS